MADTDIILPEEQAWVTSKLANLFLGEKRKAVHDFNLSRLSNSFHIIGVNLSFSRSTAMCMTHTYIQIRLQTPIIPRVG